MTQSGASGSSAPPVPIEGLVTVFTGDGKGKTSAAMGSVVRALGHGLRVYVLLFMKGQDFVHGEINILSQLPNVTIANFGQRGWINKHDIKPEHKEQARKALATAREAMLSGNYDLIVLDEINIAVAGKLVELDDVIKLIDDKPPTVELILTGRYAKDGLIEQADLVTECLKIKHPYDKGITSREGIEY